MPSRGPTGIVLKGSIMFLKDNTSRYRPEYRRLFVELEFDLFESMPHAFRRSPEKVFERICATTKLLETLDRAETEEAGAKLSADELGICREEIMRTCKAAQVVLDLLERGHDRQKNETDRRNGQSQIH
jgi:hypothetical protein